MAAGDLDQLVADVLLERHSPGAVVVVSTGGDARTILGGTATNAGAWFEIGSVTKLLVAPPDETLAEILRRRDEAVVGDSMIEDPRIGDP